ncbi:MAG: hypothetical protein AABM67_09605 [Acidobacteriota bacterium]
MSFSIWIRSFLGKRTLYPTSRFNRIFFWFGVIFIPVYLGSLLTLKGGWVDWLFLLMITLELLIIVYVLQDRPEEKFVEEYTVVITHIEDISKRLSELDIFLKRERQRVEESEAILARLRNEKTELEPVVLAQRETVNAVLAAHTRAIASRAWKERALGFMTGLLASLVASMVYGYFTR